MTSQFSPALDTAIAPQVGEIAVLPSLEELRAPARRGPLLVGGLVVAAALLRIPTLSRAFWVDEGISVGIASHRLAELPRLLRLDGSPPLYYVLLHFWLSAFGTSEVSAHTLSFLISLAVIPLAWWSARQFFGDAAGLCAAALAATNPFLAWYATETRMYPLVCALAIVGVTMAVRAVRDRTIRDAVWAVVAFGALIYTHNWGLYLVVATCAVIGVDALLRRERAQLVAVACGAAALAVMFLPWLPTFMAQARNTAAPWAVRPPVGDLFADPASVLGGTLGIVMGPLLIWGILACWRKASARQGRIAAIILVVGCLTAVEGWVAAQIEPSWASRYLAVFLAPILIAVAGLLGTSRKGRQVVVAATTLLAGWSVIGSLLPDSNADFAKSNVAAVTRLVNPIIQPGDLIVVTQSEQLAVVAHYLPGGLQFATPLGAVSDPHVVDWRHLTRRLAAADPCQSIAPELAAVPPGGHVFVVNPFEPIGAAGTRWSWAVNGQVQKIDDLLLNDPGLQLIGTFSPALAPEPFSPVIGLLFLKGTGAPPCE